MHFLKSCENVVIQHVLFYVWLLSRGLFQVHPCRVCRWFFLWLRTTPLCASVWITISLSTPHFVVVWVIPRFWLLQITSVHICVQVFVYTYDFISLEKISRSGKSGSYYRCMFNFLGNCKIFSEAVVPSYHQRCIKVPLAPDHPQLLI